MAQSLDQTLEQLRAESDIAALLLAGIQGNLVATARSDAEPPETLVELLNIVKRIISRPDSRAALVEQEEALFFDSEGRQIICRSFNAADGYLLVILMPAAKPYKRVVGQLVKSLQSVLTNPQ